MVSKSRLTLSGKVVNKRSSEMSKVEGGLLVARALAEEGITHITALCGGHTSPILRGCQQLGIRVIDTRHEEAAVHMAVGWAEVTGKPGVAAVTAGPGVTNSFGAMAKADLADCPILLIGGASSIARRYLGEAQEIESVKMMEPVTRWAREAQDIRRIPEFVGSAFRNMLNGRTGPVFLSFPTDVMHKQVDEEEVKTVKQQNVAKPSADEGAVQKAAHLLEQAERPIVLAGRGVRWAGAENALSEFVKGTGIPLFTGFMNRALVPEDEPLNMGLAIRTGTIAHLGVQKADAILAVGLKFDYNFGYGKSPYIAQDAKVIHINIDPTEVSRNRPVDVGIAADPGSALSQIQAAFSTQKGLTSRGKWVDALQKERKKFEAEMQPLLDSDEKPIHPARLWREIRDFLPRDAIVTGDGGDCFFWGLPIIKIYEPGHFVKCSAEMGHLGSGIPMAIAAKVARPDVPVLAFTGDGSFGFNAMEFDTAIRHNIPFVCVVASDGAWGLVKRGWNYGDEPVAMDLGIRHYERMVEGLGGYGEFVTEPRDILPALERAFGSQKPVCINVVTQGLPAPTYA